MEHDAPKEALRLLATEDARQEKLHELLETIREQIRLHVAPEHRPEGLFKNIQDAVYAMRGRTRLMDDAAITSPLTDAPAQGTPVRWERRNAGNDWTPIHDCSPENLEGLKRCGWEIRPLYASQPPAAPVTRYYCQTCCGTGKYDSRMCGLPSEADTTCIDCKGAGIEPAAPRYASPEQASWAINGAHDFAEGLRTKPAAPVETVKPQDHSVSVLIEALYRCGCPVAGNMTVGKCAETEQCGCSLQAARLKGCMGPDHQQCSAGTEGETKTVYVKRWRTLVKLPAKYADEIVSALRIPAEPQGAPKGPAGDAGQVGWLGGEFDR